MNMSLGPGHPHLQNFRSISSLEVELSKTWPKNGPYMILAWSHKPENQRTCPLDQVE